MPSVNGALIGGPVLHDFCLIFLMFLLRIIEENAPGSGASARFYRPGGRGLNSFCAGVGNSPIKKISWGFCRGGGWSGLELTDTSARFKLPYE